MKKKIKDFKKIKIAYNDYTVKYIKGISNGKGVHGECVITTKTIELDDDLGKSDNVMVLIHEMMHAIADVFDESLNKEEYIRKFTNMVCTLMKDNRDLFKTIIEEI